VNIALTKTYHPTPLAELVIGPATSGRTRWLATLPLQGRVKKTISFSWRESSSLPPLAAGRVGEHRASDASRGEGVPTSDV